MYLYYTHGARITVSRGGTERVCRAGGGGGGGGGECLRGTRSFESRRGRKYPADSAWTSQLKDV